MDSERFLKGITDKYPEPLLKGRVEAEGNVVSCMFKDMLLLDEISVEAKDFITKDGRFYYGLLKDLREKGFSTIDEMTIATNTKEEVFNAYEERGGWETINTQIEITNLDNFDTYLDILYRENTLLKLHTDGFNLITPIEYGDKKVMPIKLFRKMQTSEDVLEWLEARMSSYQTGVSSKVLEEEEIDFTDEWVEACASGEEAGVPFEFAGYSYDELEEKVSCFPQLSREINGLQEGTLSFLGGFSNAGKSSMWVNVIMGLLHSDRKVLIISNEEACKNFKTKFLCWFLIRKMGYKYLTRKKLTSGDITEQDRAKIKEFQTIWNNDYKGRLKFIGVEDANMPLVKKKIRENVLRYGYDTVLYDTFKIDEADVKNSRTDLSLVMNSRDLQKIARKLNIIMLASVQLAEHARGTLFLSASVLSNAKQIKEVCDNLFLMRSVYSEEVDPKSKQYCKPFKKVKNEATNKWEEEQVEIDTSKVYRMFFIEKSRTSQTSPDTGIAYLLGFGGEWCNLYEQALCRPSHGMIV